MKSNYAMDENLYNEIIDFTRALVRIPSRTEKESEQVIAEFIFRKLQEFGFNPEIVGPESQPSVICYIEKNPEKKTIWLEAPLDTSKSTEYGEWAYPPFEGVIEDGKMYGCGIASCKVAIAMYCILARELAKNNNFDGNIFLAFNSDEQCGSLTGAREIIPRAPKADICLLGYQGMEDVAIGARGWLRLHLQTIGKAGHTGSRSVVGTNAIHMMARAINSLASLRFKVKKDTFFWFGPSIHFTTIRGGIAMNVIPEYCRVNIDVRLVLDQTDQDVLRQVNRELEKIKKRDKDFDYQLDTIQYQPAYLTNPADTFIEILQKNIQLKLGSRLPLVASGHGSAGNLISELGVPIINAFGVVTGNEHDKDEWIEVESIKIVYEILQKSLIQFSEK